MRCSTLCGKKAYYYCSACTVNVSKPVACCGIRTGRDCFAKHAREVYVDVVNNQQQPLPNPPVVNNTPAHRRERRSPRSRS